MLQAQTAHDATGSGNGSPISRLAELRLHLAGPTSLPEGLRRRLQQMSRRLERVRVLGGEYGRVELSEHAAAALGLGVALA